MLKKTVPVVLLLLLMPIALAGCWNRRELSELSIASAFGYDKKEGSYQVSVQLINSDEIATTSNGSKGRRMPVITQQITGGRTIFESVRELTTVAPRRVYAAHIRVLVIGEELAREGIAKVLDGVSRDHELRTDFYIIVAKQATAEEVLKILTPLEKIPANKLYTSLRASEESWGVSVKTDLHQLLADLVSKGKDPVLAAIRIVGNPDEGQSDANLDAVNPPVVQQFQGAAVFRKDKLVGYLGPGETIGYNFLRGNIRSTIVSIPCKEPGRAIGVEVIRSRSKIKAAVKQGKPEFNVNVHIEGNVGEVECAIKLGEEAVLHKLEEQMNAQVKGMIEKSLNKGKAYKADIFGFGQKLHRTDPKLWRRMKDDWDERFPQYPVHVEVVTDIRRTGSVVESFMERMED